MNKGGDINLSKSENKNKNLTLKKNEYNKEENDSIFNCQNVLKLKNNCNNIKDFELKENNDIKRINNLNKDISNLNYLAYTNNIGIMNKAEKNTVLNKNLSTTVNDFNSNYKNFYNLNSLQISTNYFKSPASININSSLTSRVNNTNQNNDNDIFNNGNLTTKSSILSRNLKNSNNNSNNINVACETNDNSININSKNKIQINSETGINCKIVSLDPKKMINIHSVKVNGNAAFPGKKIKTKHIIRELINPLDELYKVQHQKKLQRLEKIKYMNQNLSNDLPKKIVPAFGRTAYSFFNKKKSFDLNSPIKPEYSKCILKQTSTSENILNAKINHHGKIRFITENNDLNF